MSDTKLLPGDLVWLNDNAAFAGLTPRFGAGQTVEVATMGLVVGLQNEDRAIVMLPDGRLGMTWRRAESINGTKTASPRRKVLHR